METLKTIGHYLLCEHIIEPFRCSASSWKRGRRVWCFATTVAFVGVCLVAGYTAYLFCFDYVAIFLEKVPSDFTSFGLFSLTENTELARKHHLFAMVTTILFPLHRFFYDTAIRLFYGGYMETCEDEWPCEAAR